MMEEERKSLSDEELEKVAGGGDYLSNWVCRVCGTVTQGAEPPAACRVCGNNNGKRFEEKPIG